MSRSREELQNVNLNDWFSNACPPSPKSRPGAGHVFNNVLSENNLCFSFQLSEFQCEDGKKCIQKYQKCNHRSECEDNSDEKDCSKFIFSFFAAFSKPQSCPRCQKGSKLD